MSDPQGARVVLFAPEARLWPSYRLQLSLIDAWQSMGASVRVLGCEGLFDDLCPVMLASHVGPSATKRERAYFCRECTSVASLGERHLPFDYESLDVHVSAGIRQQVDALMAQVTPANWQSIEWEGIPFGRYASYLSMLTYKTHDVTKSPEAWQAYLIDLRNSLVTYLACDRLVAEYEPSHALVYDRLYPAHRAFLLAMRKHGVPATGVTGGAFIPRRYDSMVFHPYVHASQTLVDSTNVRAALDSQMTQEEVSDVAAQICHLIVGNDPWVYSTNVSARTPVEVREALNLPPEGPVGVVLVGSPDETRSSLLVDAEFDRTEGAGVSDVVEFVSVCVAAAGLATDIHIVIRLHPRLAANKRERVTSPDLEAIRSVLSDLPANVVVNSPGDGVGLHDVMRIANFGVNHGSTSGLEFLAFGLPVIHVDPHRLNAYPPTLGTSVTRGDYEELARHYQSELNSDWSVTRAVPAWRWLATVLLRISVQQQPAGTAQGPHHSTAPPEYSQKRSFRGLIPRRWREAISRRVAWSGLRQEISREIAQMETGTKTWAEESWSRFDQACQDSLLTGSVDAASSHIWEPDVTTRGSTALTSQQEHDEVATQLHHLIEMLGPVTGPGSGLLGQASLR